MQETLALAWPLPLVLLGMGRVLVVVLVVCEAAPCRLLPVPCQYEAGGALEPFAGTAGHLHRSCFYYSTFRHHTLLHTAPRPFLHTAHHEVPRGPLIFVGLGFWGLDQMARKIPHTNTLTNARVS